MSAREVAVRVAAEALEAHPASPARAMWCWACGRLEDPASAHQAATVVDALLDAGWRAREGEP